MTMTASVIGTWRDMRTMRNETSIRHSFYMSFWTTYAQPVGYFNEATDCMLYKQNYSTFVLFHRTGQYARHAV